MVWSIAASVMLAVAVILAMRMRPRASPAKNGDGARHLVKLAIEFYHNQDPRFVDVVRRLKMFLHVAHIHFNNFSCDPRLEAVSGLGL